MEGTKYGNYGLGSVVRYRGVIVFIHRRLVAVGVWGFDESKKSRSYVDAKQGRPPEFYGRHCL